MKTSIETIIIGAGISGLACANRLHAENRDFLVISKDMGGRVRSSKVDPKIGLGGIYATSDYLNLLPFVDIIEPFRVRDFYFLNDKSYKTVFHFRNIKYFPKLLRFIVLLWKFRNRLTIMRKNAEREELSVLIENDPLLKKYWHLPANDFLKQYGFEELDYHFGQPTAGTNLFTTTKDLNTFYYLYLFMSMIRPTYIVNLSQTADRLSKGFESKILIGTVVKIEKQTTGTYLVKTETDEFFAKNVVIAAPYLGILEAYNVPRPSKITSVYVFHISGKRKKIYENKKGIVLHPDFHDAYLLWSQKYGGDLIYSKIGNLDLSKYYDSSTIKDKIFWETAMQISDGTRIIKQKLDTGLYLASDYNFSLMEDTFITGIYSANQIIKSDGVVRV